MNIPESARDANGNALVVHTADGDFAAFIALPAVLPAPAVVVIQEIFGINADLRETCRRYSAQGFIAVCPDLFWRQQPGVSLTDKSQAEWAQAFALYQGFDIDAGVRDIAATIAAIRHLPSASGKVGAVGYCLGGLLAFLSAARTDVDATASYYGGGIDKYLGEAGQVRHSLILHLGEDDEFISKAAQQEIAAALGSHPLISVYSYPGCQHAFARNHGVHYDEAAAKQANARTLALFERQLK
ncbi:dienelactone hydrolase family protein [Pseudomonas sp. UL073]|uniref:Dienelactone hydrolase family protein n=1 Tax=Zestomonas insulae TaxID=2809017 RepID=A0ABS2IIM3_9GAMM|nr:dienelactone hydrolase family protein [Pseudomonas insulae]MBM7062916.1 dienelactone hydrolase family protein [Pseudomonas insulae]